LSATESGIYPLASDGDIYFVTHPEGVREIFSGSLHLVRPAKLDPVRALLGDGTAASEYGEDATSLSSTENQEALLARYRLQKRRSLRPLLWRIENVEDTVSSASNRIRGAVDVNAILRGIAAELTTRELFNRAFTEGFATQLRTIFNSEPDLVRYIGSLQGQSPAYVDRPIHGTAVAWSAVPEPFRLQLQSRHRALNSVADHLMGSVPSATPGRDVCCALTQTLKTNPDSVDVPTRLRHAVLGAFFASFENIATVAAWTLWCLAGHPEWQNRSRHEILLYRKDPSPTSLPITLACIQETARLYPPVWSMVRQAEHDIHLCGVKVAKGYYVLVSPWVQQRHCGLWEHASAFAPERFLQSNPLSSGNYFPFGVGPLSCPGREVAINIILRQVTVLLDNFEFVRIPTAPAPVPFFGLTQRPAAGVWLEAKHHPE
jgi:hypothetical protein